MQHPVLPSAPHGRLLRKSIRVGPVRFNLSKSGVGTSVVLLYDMDDEAQHRYRRLHDAFDRFGACAGKWHLEAQGATADRNGMLARALRCGARTSGPARSLAALRCVFRCSI